MKLDGQRQAQALIGLGAAVSSGGTSPSSSSSRRSHLVLGEVQDVRYRIGGEIVSLDCRPGRAVPTNTLDRWADGVSGAMNKILIVKVLLATFFYSANYLKALPTISL